MGEQIDITKANLNILLEIDGEIYAVAYEKKKLEAISFIVKSAAANIIKTGRTQKELTKFIGLLEG